MNIPISFSNSDSMRVNIDANPCKFFVREDAAGLFHTNVSKHVFQSSDGGSNDSDSVWLEENMVLEVVGGSNCSVDNIEQFSAEGGSILGTSGCNGKNEITIDNRNLHNISFDKVV